MLCPSFSSFATSNRPTPDHYRAVLFDPDKSKPTFIWLPCEWLQDEDGKNVYQMPKIATIIGSDTGPGDISLQYDSRLKRPLPNTIFIMFRDTFLVDGSRPSQSIASITAAQPGEHLGWRGPVFAFAKKGLGIDPPACMDLDMVHSRHVVDHFLSYGYKSPKAQANAQLVKGVRINCRGDVQILKRPPFEAIDVPSTHAIFTKHDTSDIADWIGIPILTKHCPPDPE